MQRTIRTAEGHRPRFFKGWLHGWAAVLLVVLLVAAGTMRPALAQSPRPTTRKPSPAEIKRLDTQLNQAYGVFLNQTVDLITSYENLGQFDRAKVIVEALAKLDPENEKMKAKIAELERQMLEAGVFEVDLVPGEGWQAIGAVSQGDVVRVQITGEYRFQAAGATTADGIAGDSPDTDFMRGIPLGAVMGVIEPPVATEGDKKAGKPRPFVVGATYDKRADKDGVLYLKANLPAGTKCTGRLEATITGPRR